MANNETIPEREEAMVTMAEAAAEKLHQMVHSDAVTEIETESGPLPSLAKWQADASDFFSSSAEIAATARAAAEVARDAAQLSAGVYVDTAAGLAATVSGAYFNVPSIEDAEYLVLYRNSAGVAIEQKRYPSASAVEEVSSNIRPSEPKGTVFAVADEGGFVKYSVREDGSFGTEQASIEKDRIVNQSFEVRDSTLDVVFAATDAQGFAKFVVREDNSFGTQGAELGETGVRTQAFDIAATFPGVRFAVGDAHGYFALYIREGEAVHETGNLMEDVHRLKRDFAASVHVGAAIPTSRREVIAHRGTTLGGIAPENSLDAYKLSARAGYRKVETDVLKTADGQFVLMHDNSINRTCRNAADYSVISGTVDVSSRTLAELRSNYVLAATNPRYRRKIPTLDEFLATCRDFGLYPVIELKDVTYSNEDVAAIATRAVELLGVEGFALTSFNPAQLDHVRTIFAGVQLYYIYGAVGSVEIDHMVEMQPAALYASYDKYTAASIAEAHRKGVTVAAWTVPNAQFDPMLKIGLDEFATDTLAPTLKAQQVLFRDYSGITFEAYLSDGVLSDGVLQLAQGKKLQFVARPELAVELGAYYLSLDIIGAAYLSGTRLGANVANASDDFVPYSAQCLLFNESPTFTITAGAGGCAIKDARLAIAEF